MKAKPLPERNQVQKNCEAVLWWSIPVIAFYHIGLLLSRYFIADSVSASLLAAEKWALIALVGMTSAYCIYTMFVFPEQMCRIKAYLKGLFQPELIILSILFVWNLFCVVSADKIYQNNMWELNDSSLFELFASFFVFFAFAYHLSGRHAEKAMEVLFHTIVVVTTGLMIWVLWAVCKPSVIFLPGGDQIGMTSRARLCINCHPNTVGAYAEIILMICLYMVVTKKGIVRILYILAIPVHYFVLILSDSRTCMITTAFTAGVIAFKLVFDTLKGKTTWQRTLFGLLSFAACCIVIMGLRKPVRMGYEAISHFSELNGEGAVNTGRSIELTTNGRLELWIASVESAFSDTRHAFFGVTPVAVVSEINKWTGKDQGFYTHNQFFEVLVSNGLPGLLLYVSWLVFIAKKCIKNGLLRTGAAHKGTVVLCGMILMLVIANLFEATLLYYRFFVGSLFFLFCGMMAYHEEEEKKGQIQKKNYNKKGKSKHK